MLILHFLLIINIYLLNTRYSFKKTEAAWHSNIDLIMGKVKMKSYVLYPQLILCNVLKELCAIRNKNINNIIYLYCRHTVHIHIKKLLKHISTVIIIIIEYHKIKIVQITITLISTIMAPFPNGGANINNRSHASHYNRV